jgi:ABC-type antimicrobial peptide transport system permease subunit
MADIEEGNVLEAAGVNLPPEPEAKAGLLKPVPETTLLERLFIAIAFSAVGTAIAAMVASLFNIVVVIAGILSILMGPYSYYQQTQLTDIATLKETAAAVQVEVDRLGAENDRLGKSVDELGNTVDDLKDVEKAFNTITATQGQSIGDFEVQVEENREILKNMKKSTRGRVIQNFISIIYRGDEDQDDLIDSGEVENVIRGIEKIGGVQVKEDLLREAISGKSIDSVIEVIKNLTDPNTPDEEKIFILEEDE